MATVYKILIVIILLLFLNQNAFSKRKSFLRSMRIRIGKKVFKHSRTGAKKTIKIPSNIERRTNANNNAETNKLLLAALYGGLGMGVASTENFDYTNGLNSKIQVTGGYGVPPGIYSYAFDPKTGMPYMCDPTKTPPGGASQVSAAVQQPAAAAKPVITPPAKSPPAVTVGHPPGVRGTYQADQTQHQLGKQTSGTNTQGEPTPGKITHEQQQLVASGDKGKGGQSDSKNQQRLSPINEMSASMTLDNSAKDDKDNDGQTPTPPGKPVATPGKVIPPGKVATPPGKVATPPGKVATPPGKVATPPGKVATPPGKVAIPPGKAATPPGKAATPLALQTQNANEDEDLMAPMSPNNSKNDAKNDDDKDGQTSTPPGSPALTPSLSNNGLRLYPLHVSLTSRNDKVKSPGSKILSSSTGAGSATGTPIFAQNPKLYPQKVSTPTTNANKVTGVKLTPLVANSHHTVQPIATKQKSFNSLTKLIKEQKYKALKRNMVNIKLPDIPACPDMKDYHWPWNCLENGNGNSIKKECIQTLQQLYSYPAYSNQLPYAGFTDYSSEQPDAEYPSELPSYDSYYKR